MHWTIKTRLMAMGALGVVTAVLLGVIGLRGVSRVANSTQSIHLASTGLRNHLESDMMHDALRADVLAALLADSKEDREAVQTDLEEHSTWFRKMIAANEKIDMGPEVSKAIGETKPSLEAYIASAERIIALAGQDRAAATAQLPAFLATFKELEDRMSTLSTLIESTNEKAAGAASNEEHQAMLWMVIVGSLGTILLLASSALLIRSVIGPIEKVVSAMKDIAEGEGDLTKRMNIATRDEIGQLSIAFDQFIAKMHDIIANVRESSEHVSQASRELTAASDTISSSAQEQASSLEETAASLEEITATIKQNADNAGLANQLAANAREVAEKGGRVVAGAVTAMGEINDSSRKIADIITTIDEIAFQTNLLALNAAVEAARAGEQGRGFAVVASEVRSLAQRSASAAREIKGLIGDSVKKVEDGSQLVNRSGATLDEIVTAVKRVTDVVAEIAAASREQSVGVEEVNKAVTQMDHVTQSNAAQTEELSATAGHLSDQAREVLNAVSRFRLSHGAPSQAVAVTASPAARRAASPTPIAHHPAYAHASKPAAVSALRTGTDDDGFEEF